MKLLLDTHVFLWFITADSRLPSDWLLPIREPANDVFLSVVSFWEVVIKHNLGKIPLPEPPEKYIPAQRTRHSIQSLSIDELCVQRLASLPSVHRDPFDRMLVCQALEHQMTIVTVDDTFSNYPVPVLPRTTGAQ